MPLTGAPAARFPKYLQASQFDRYPDLDENGHDDAALETTASEHSRDHEIGWIDASALYITDGDDKVIGFRKADGSVASEDDLAADGRRYARNFSADGRFCHVYNHSHVCKPTCFKKQNIKNHLPIKQPSSDRRADSYSGDTFSSRCNGSAAWAKHLCLSR